MQQQTLLHHYALPVLIFVLSKSTLLGVKCVMNVYQRRLGY